MNDCSFYVHRHLRTPFVWLGMKTPLDFYRKETRIDKSFIKEETFLFTFGNNWRKYAVVNVFSLHFEDK